MTSSWPFPPETREVRLDEKWSFVAKKPAPCDPDDPADDHEGDWWDHVAYDAEHRLVLAVVPGARSIENAEEIVTEVHDRTGGRSDVLLTSDEYPAYATAIDHVDGVPEPPKPPGTPGRPAVVPGRQIPAGLKDATVPKGREKGRVVAIVTAVVLGTWAAVVAALQGVEGEPDDRHVVRRAAPSHRPPSQRAEVAADVPVQQGPAGPRGDDRPDDVELQLLLAGADTPPARGRRGVSEDDPSDGRRPDGSCLVTQGMAGPTRSAISQGHDPEFRESGRHTPFYGPEKLTSLRSGQ